MSARIFILLQHRPKQLAQQKSFNFIKCWQLLGKVNKTNTFENEKRQYNRSNERVGNEHFYVFASRKFAKRPLQWKESFMYMNMYIFFLLHNLFLYIHIFLSRAERCEFQRNFIQLYEMWLWRLQRPVFVRIDNEIHSLIVDCLQSHQNRAHFKCSFLQIAHVQNVVIIWTDSILPSCSPSLFIYYKRICYNNLILRTVNIITRIFMQTDYEPVFMWHSFWSKML